METLPFPSTGYLVGALANLVLFTLGFRYAWKHQRHLAFVMLAAALFGWLVEYSQLIRPDSEYYYTQAVVSLPGPMPLGVVLGWGIMMFILVMTTEALALHWTVRPLLAGLLGVSLDLVADPPFVYMDFWVWKNGGAWFGIPWSNYVGWFLLLALYLYFLELGVRWLLPRRKGVVGEILVAFLPIIPSFFLFQRLIDGYQWLVAQGIVVDQVVIAVLLGGSALIVAPFLYRARRDQTPIKVVLVVPAFAYVSSILGLYTSGLYLAHPQLVVVSPVVAMVSGLIFCWAYLERLLPPSVAGGGAVR
ncbi:carotenoid biosynthesis protein [Endothiovibrio diazotrophicus]